MFRDRLSKLMFSLLRSVSELSFRSRIELFLPNGLATLD